MPPRGGFTPEPASLGELEAVIGRSPEMKALLMSLGEEILAAAQHEAEPLGHRHPGQGTGASYRESFGVALRPSGRSMAAVIYNDSYDAVWNELGSHPRGGTTPAQGYHILAKALESVMGAAAIRKVQKGLNSNRARKGVKPKQVGG